MNTAEHAVETYFRVCRKCFTMPDVKVLRGNNRQFDLLAFNLLEGDQYHVEVSVTHCQRWCPTPGALAELFDRKFFGHPHPRNGERTDHARGRTYEEEILDTYRAVGMDPDRVQRVWCAWTVAEDKDLEDMLDAYSSEHGLDENPIEFLSFRDVVLPELREAVNTANYEDEILRMLSFLQQEASQREREREPESVLEAPTHGGQDRTSGARANLYGHETARFIARHLGAQPLTSHSNEFELNGQRVTIRCARRRTTSVGVTYGMLDRVERVIAAFEQETGSYRLYALLPNTYRKRSRDSKGEGRVGLVSRQVFYDEGDDLGEVGVER